MDTKQRTRYEIPAVIVVDAVDQQDAWTRARNLSATLAAEAGPGAFFSEVGVAPTNKPRTPNDLEGRETVEEHVESIRAAVGDDWVWFGYTIHNDPKTALWTITAPPGGKEYGPYGGSEDAAIHCAREEGAEI